MIGASFDTMYLLTSNIRGNKMSEPVRSTEDEHSKDKCKYWTGTECRLKRKPSDEDEEIKRLMARYSRVPYGEPVGAPSRSRRR